MAEVGSKPQGTRVVLFKQSSFLFSHPKKNERVQIEEEKNEMFLSLHQGINRSGHFSPHTLPFIFPGKRDKDFRKKVVVNNGVKTKTWGQWGTERGTERQ